MPRDYPKIAQVMNAYQELTEDERKVVNNQISHVVTREVQVDVAICMY